MTLICLATCLTFHKVPLFSSYFIIFIQQLDRDLLIVLLNSQNMSETFSSFIICHLLQGSWAALFVLFLTEFLTFKYHCFVLQFLSENYNPFILIFINIIQILQKDKGFTTLVFISASTTSL